MKIVEETRENADLLALRTGSLKNNNPNQGNNPGATANSLAAVDEVKDLRNRVHLLTEENQVLFE